jgi:hypothetical protein
MIDGMERTMIGRVNRLRGMVGMLESLVRCGGGVSNGDLLVLEARSGAGWMGLSKMWSSHSWE